MNPEKRLNAQKKVSAATSIVGGTLGLGALGMLASKNPKWIARSAKTTTVGAGLGGVGAYNYASIQNQEAKKKPPRQNVYVVRNKKQIKNIKSGLEPVKKGFETMDFGLGDQHQGQNVELIFKAVTAQQHKERRENSSLAGAVAAPAAGYFGSRGAQAGKAGFGLSRSLGGSRASSVRSGAQAVPSAIRGAARSGQMLNSYLSNPGKAAALTVGGAVAGGAAYNKLAMKPKKPKGPVQPKGIAKSWVPKLSHSKVAVTGSRGTKKYSTTTVGTTKNALWEHKGANVTTGRRGSNFTVDVDFGRGSLTDAGRTVRNATATGVVAGSVYEGGRRAFGNKKNQVHKGWSENHPKGRFQNIAYHEKRKDGGVYRHDSDTLHTTYRGKSLILRRPKYQTVGVPSHKARKGSEYVAEVSPNRRMPGGSARAVHEAYRTNSKTVTFPTGQKVKHKVEKAYNPEQKRQRRLDHTATGLSVGSGAAALGAGHYARQAIGTRSSSQGQWKTKVVETKSKVNPQHTVKRIVNERVERGVKGTGLRSNTLPGFKAGLKSAGKAGALGATAVGLAVGSDRVRSYRRGNGSSYRQLHRGD